MSRPSSKLNIATAPSAASRWAGLRSDPRAVLLPLRVFLGVVYLYAGLSKIADRTFLDASSPLSMHASVLAVKAQSPIGGLLGPVVDHSWAFGVLIALGETAVGLGTLAGLFHRVAALGGLALALSLFLTISWGASPWYTGADLGYLVAFTPLLLAGPTPLSADAWLASVAARRAQELDRDDAGERSLRSEDRTRRAALAGISAVTALVAVAVASLTRGRKPATQAARTQPGVATGASRAVATQPTPRATSAAAGAVALAKAADIPVGGAKQVNDPQSGDPLWLMQLDAGKYTAVSATCPHQGCPVKFVSKSAGFVCPCHQSAFAADGTLRKGPATRGLTAIPVSDDGGEISRP